MEYTRLCSSGLKVSRIALGTMGFGDEKVPFWSWALPWDDAKGFFVQALDQGINLWDTTNVYGAGSCEEIVGRALAETRRDDVVLATKVHQKVGDGPGGEGATKPHHLPDAVAALDIALTEEEITPLEEHYTYREPTYF